ncbi:MAG: hypothetical protein R3A51_03810 [Nannocystaceae bacterium]
MREPSLDPALVAALAEHGLVARGRGLWELVTEVETHRYLSLRVSEAGGGLVYTLSVEEWRGGEGYEEDVLKTMSVAEVEAALSRWSAWAAEPFRMTRWRRLLSRFGLHFLYGR